MKLRQPKLNKPDAYKVGVYWGEDSEIIFYMQHDPRLVLLGESDHCSQRRMSWYYLDGLVCKIVIYDLVYRDGQLWDGYDTNQIRGYSNFAEFLADPVVRPANYYFSQY